MTTPVHPGHANPAARLIAEFGAKRLSEWTGRHPSRVHAWSWPVSRGGTGGVVPHKVRAAIVAGAGRELDRVLLTADFEPREGEGYDFQTGAAA